MTTNVLLIVYISYSFYDIAFLYHDETELTTYSFFCIATYCISECNGFLKKKIFRVGTRVGTYPSVLVGF